MSKITTRLRMAPLFYGLALLVAPVSLNADDRQQTEHAIRIVIQTQLNAFSQGDSETAYAQASPKIRAIFPNKEIFLRMVENGYAALISPSRVEFLGLLDDEGDPVYRVIVESSNGKQWMVFYQMALQPDSGWKIGGCILTPIAGRSV